MKKVVLTGAFALVTACSPKAAEVPKSAESVPEAAVAAAEKAAAKVTSVIGEEVTYKAGDTELKGYIAYDASKVEKRPGVLVVHEWWGHNEFTRDRAKQLAELGYTALAVDMYGDGKKADHPGDAKKFMMEVMGNLDAGVARFEAALSVLNSHPSVNPEKTAAIGYCFGGGIVLHMARTDLDIDAVAAFHAGALSTGIEAKKGDPTKIFVAHGAADPFVKPEAIEAFKKEMDAAEMDYEFVAYEGAKHAFTNPGATEKGKKFELPLEYQKEADEQSWEKMKALFAKAFEG
ncbi:MAG: dienelactone hydrolase family protein [Myxococcota bacterium]